MDRKLLYNELSKIANVRQLSNREGLIDTNTLILAKKPLTASINNSIGCFQYWEVMCYVPATSIIALDTLVKKVTNTLKKLDVELTNNNTTEFYDETLKAYMVSVEFRTILTN